MADNKSPEIVLKEAGAKIALADPTADSAKAIGEYFEVLKTGQMNDKLDKEVLMMLAKAVQSGIDINQAQQLAQQGFESEKTKVETLSTVAAGLVGAAGGVGVNASESEKIKVELQAAQSFVNFKAEGTKEQVGEAVIGAAALAGGIGAQAPGTPATWAERITAEREQALLTAKNTK